MIAWIFASIDTRSNGFFKQRRIGRNAKPFYIVKIRTMKTTYSGVKGESITVSGDSRVTRLGAFFRKTKIDELPQLWNVLVGDMSFVGPRPDVPGYADQLQGHDRNILCVRPGITGPAQLFYKDEEILLSEQADPLAYNDQVMWPNKVSINLNYVENYSFFKDIGYIWKTVLGGGC